MLKTLYEEADKLGYQPRDVQVKAIEWLETVWNSPNICKVISSPVGSGKSLVAKTIASYVSKQDARCAIITTQNILVDQYEAEFNDLNSFKGKKNYYCKETESTCEDGLEIAKLTKKPCPECPYNTSKQRCYDEGVSIYNTMSYFYLPKLKTTDSGLESLYEADTIIIDEFQSLAGMLRSLATIKIWWHDIQWEKGVSSSIPEIINLLRKYSSNLLFYISSPMGKKDKLPLIQTQKKIDNMVYLLGKDSHYFICEESVEKYRGDLTNCLQIRPKYVPPAVFKNFFKLCERVVLMSGTAFPYMWQELGFKSVDYIDLPSPIPKDRRLVFITDSISINAKQDKLERWDMAQELALQIKYIVNEIHPDESGVVLLSYGLAEELKSLLSEKHFYHMDKHTKKDKIDEFKQNNKRRVGIFSGSYEGLSLNGDISRFTIIPKTTYPNLMDKVVKVRQDENPLNYALETIATIIQASGRSTRSEKDYSAIYILDKSFPKLYSRTRAYIPKYFKESVVFGLPEEKHINQFNEFRRENEITTNAV